MRRLSAAGLVFVLLILAGCKTAAPPPPETTIPPEERAFLLDPTVSAPSVEPALRAQIQEAFRSLDLGRSAAEVEAIARKMLASAADNPAALVLLAEAEFLSGRFREAADRLGPLLANHPSYTAAGLLAARSLEKLEAKFAAFEVYHRFSETEPIAAAKASELAAAAIDLLAEKARAAVAEGQLEEADKILSRLDSLSPHHRRSLEIRLEIAKVRGQPREELAILRQLAPMDSGNGYRERLGNLEVELGDVKAGLEILESLLRAEPSNADFAAQVDRAKFRWRLERLPKRVQNLVRKPELTRADLATLIFWLLPQVQHSPAVDPPISSDILNHPAQQEILRVTDLDLMEVDETLHRFNPDVATSRRATLAALLAVMAQQGVPCVAGEPLARDARAWVCRKSVECGLLREESQCQPGTSISGTDAVDLLKDCLDHLGDP